ncbi:MarR family winged helix-turn-helix transcriptional regulator [Mucilaginibacter psychrotolerans]|uniref:MarR family transcriptional regulator n=1 Tax=Mucilaginibacter psychrotolerans TaxID=1524096 RepID=A0A4Y8S747_9SPHI|nr:winged helix DNA-binding protein [Mucilaginibacter psychrotolerans]TFF34839.1 MarR family transcriptional regulator [Mucilaginibacter psychrotolerans]
MNFGEDLSLQLMLANKSYHQYLFTVLKEIDVYQHYQIILLLSRQGGRSTQKFIGDTLLIEKSNMVAIIAALEEKGYVYKTVNHKDRRSKLVSLTAKAQDTVGIMNNLFNVFEEQMAEDLTWQEMYNCIRVLNKVNGKLNDMLVAGN